MSDREDVKIEQPCKVHPTARLGRGTVIWAFSSVHDGVVMGENCSLGERAYIGRNTRIGDRVRIGEKAHITDHMVIENDVFIGPLVSFSNDLHPQVNNPWYKRHAPYVEADVSIGEAATIRAGVRIGRGAVIGQGAVVTHDVPAYETWVGNPARPLRRGATGAVSSPQPSTGPEGPGSGA